MIAVQLAPGGPWRRRAMPGARPTVLETLAITGGTPSASRVGNVISVPEPTTVLISPASPQRRAAPGRSSQLTGLRFGWLSWSRLAVRDAPEPGAVRECQDPSGPGPRRLSSWAS